MQKKKKMWHKIQFWLYWILNPFLGPWGALNLSIQIQGVFFQTFVVSTPLWHSVLIFSWFFRCILYLNVWVRNWKWACFLQSTNLSLNKLSSGGQMLSHPLHHLQGWSVWWWQQQMLLWRPSAEWGLQKYRRVTVCPQKYSPRLLFQFYIDWSFIEFRINS